VREAFGRNFAEHGDIGAATAVHHDGKLVVDLWGGTYRPDTLQLVFSTTKGWTAILANLLAEQGLLDMEAPVATYWPDFAAEGKEDIPVRMLLCHQAGLPFPSEPCSLEDCLSWDPIVEKLARSTTVWEPGTAHGYHALTYGWLVGEVIRRITGKTPGVLLREEIAGPLGLDAWIGLPEEHEGRVEPLVGGLTPNPSELTDEMRALLEQFVGADSVLGRALSCNGAFNAADGSNVFNTRAVHAAEVPAGNGIADARSLSRLYAAVVGDVEADERFPAGKRILAPETVVAASKLQTAGPDRCLMVDTTFGLGFMLSSPFAPYGGARSFGHAGAGGSVGFADPENGIGFGYVMSKMDTNLSGDPRTRGLIGAVYDAIGVEPAHV
jgi:CubicO group peptidase (beta-lactamase class C family)